MENNNLEPEKIVKKPFPFVRDLAKVSDTKRKSEIDAYALTMIQERRQKIKFNIRTGYVFVNPNDIIFCAADSNYTHITFTNQKQLTVSITLSNVMENLPPTMFLRISRSTIININFLTEIKRTEKLCILNAENKNYTFRISPKNIKSLINDFYFDY